MTLAEFLLARIAEDARWSSARVFAECEAKRRIVALCPPLKHYAPFEEEWKWCPKALLEPLGDLPGGPDEECTCNADAENARGESPILRALALPYADHPDYQQEWKP